METATTDPQQLSAKIAAASPWIAKVKEEIGRVLVGQDELVDRLEDVMPKLPAEDRATVALALDVTERLTDATDNPDEWSRIQEDVSVRNLGESVDELSDRLQLPWLRLFGRLRAGMSGLAWTD